MRLSRTLICVNWGSDPMTTFTLRAECSWRTGGLTENEVGRMKRELSSLFHCNVFKDKLTFTLYRVWQVL